MSVLPDGGLLILSSLATRSGAYPAQTRSGAAIPFPLYQHEAIPANYAGWIRLANS